MIGNATSETTRTSEIGETGKTRSANLRSPETKLTELKGGCARSATSALPAPCSAGTRRPTCRRAAPAARGRQSALLSRLAHEQSIDPALGQLLDELAAYGESLPHDGDEAALIAVARRDFEKAIRVPADFVERVERRMARPPTTPGRGRGRRTISPPCGRILEKTIELQPRICRLLRAVCACRRSADRRLRRGHDHRIGPGAVRRAAPRAGAAGAARSAIRPPATTLPARRPSPKPAQLAFSLDVVAAARLRFRPRPARQDPPSVLHQVRGRRRAHHHARRSGRHRPGAVLDHPRGRPCHVRAGRRRRARRHAARQRHLGGRA